MQGQQELELYEYELADGSKGHTAAYSVLEVYDKFQGRSVVSVQTLPDEQKQEDQQASGIFVSR